VGPVFYGGMFEVPAVQSEGLRSTNEWDGPIRLTGQAIERSASVLLGEWQCLVDLRI
jgi:hypothetical protein